MSYPNVFFWASDKNLCLTLSWKKRWICCFQFPCIVLTNQLFPIPLKGRSIHSWATGYSPVWQRQRSGDCKDWHRCFQGRTLPGVVCIVTSSYSNRPFFGMDFVTLRIKNRSQHIWGNKAMVLSKAFCVCQLSYSPENGRRKSSLEGFNSEEVHLPCDGALLLGKELCWWKQKTFCKYLKTT